MRWTPLFILLLPLSAEAVRLNVDFSSKKDSATCDWNTTRGLIRAPQTSNGQALDYGDGSDGACVFSGTVTAGEYECTSLTVNGTARFTGTNPVIIRVQGDVTINGTLSVDGFAGQNGDESFSPTAQTLAGGVAGPGGFAGGRFDAAIFPPSFAGDDNATGAGDMGGDPVGNPGNFGGGGGGAGGNWGDSALATAGANGTQTGAAVAGTGGPTSAREVASAENTFETLSPLIGGAGGGAGAYGDDNTTIWHEPGTGGGGGGVLYLVVGGNLTINGTLTANGGKGGDALDLGGAGGGGAGGTIWLQSGGNITNNGTIRALGGDGGTVTSSLAASGGNGGDGGVGRIRIDDIDGILSGNAPTPQAQTAANTAGIFDVGFQVAACTALTEAFDTIGVLNNFKAATATQTLNGGTLTIQVQDSADGVSWGALVGIASIDTLTRRYLRFDISLTPAGVASSPELDALSVNYDVIEKSSQEFKSDVSCGSVDLSGGGDDDLPPGGTLFAGFVMALIVFSKRFRRS